MKQRKTDEFYEEQLNSIVKIEKVEKSFGEKYHIQGIKSEKLKGVLERYDLDNEYEVSIFRLNGKMKEVLKNPKVSENFIEIMYCLNGECSFTSNFEKIKKIYKFNKGDIIIHRATNEIKEYEVESENLVLISIDVYLDEMIKDILEESNNRKAEEWKKKILNMFKVDEFYYGKCNEEIKILSEEINNTSVNNVGEYLTFKAKIFQFILLVLNIQFNSIETVEIAGATNQDLAEMMVGRSVSFVTEKEEAKPKDVVLQISDLIVNENRGVPAVKELSLDVHAGEIVGVAGIDGNGQSELIQAITGLRKVKSGSIKIKGREVVGLSPRKITEMQVSHVPEDRHRDGLVLEMMLSENIALQTYYKEPLSNKGVLNYNQINSYARKLMEEFDVRAASELVPAGALSGGNQQKAIIAREVDRNPDLLIVSQPTRGLDVGAIEYIHKRLISERDKGKAVLVVSFELDEILNVSDRIAVIHDGKIQGIVKPSETNKQELGILMAGGKIKEASNG